MRSIEFALPSCSGAGSFFTVLVPVRFLYLATSPQFRPLWFPQHYSLNAGEPNVPGSIRSALSGINERTTIAVFSLPPPQADSLVYLPVSWKTNSSFSWTLPILVATWLFHSFLIPLSGIFFFQFWHLKRKQHVLFLSYFTDEWRGCLWYKSMTFNEVLLVSGIGSKTFL